MQQLSATARLLILLCGLALIAVLWLPIWRIELSAPQYPEGLLLQIYAGKLGGDVEVINGLNHYIGMKTLHEKDFIEFKILPWIIIGYAAVCIIVAIIGRRKLFFAAFWLFVVIAVTSMADFYRWEYDYGHSLDPTAPIKVPDMAYQPPLIGYKKLLNFGAYSIPDSGGWIFSGVGFVLAILAWREWRKARRARLQTTPAAVLLLMVVALAGCSSGPQPIKPGTDQCHFCKMTISDPRFGAELITRKGKVYKFDDVVCLKNFRRSGVLDDADKAALWFTDFAGSHNLVAESESAFLQSEALHSPMGSNIAAFSHKDSLQQAAKFFNGRAVVWTQYLQQ
jgi:copper chaperone NosL